MTNAEQVEESNVAQLPVQQTLKAGAPVKAIVPQSMEDAFRIATAVVKAKLAPKGLDSQEQCLVAIMQGLEVGMTPMQSIQRIAVINGRATIWGDAAIGLVRASGACEYVKEWFEGEGDQFTAYCEAKRKGDPEPIRGSFSVHDAKVAGLWNKQGPWKTYPKRMLQMRARGFVLRDAFADVLGGMYLHEEMEGEQEMRDVTPPTPPPAPPAPADLKVEQEVIPPKAPKAPRQRKAGATPYKDQAAEQKQKAEEAETVEENEENFDPDKFLDGLEDMMAGCSDQATLDEVWNNYVEPLVQKKIVLDPDREKANAIFERNMARIEGDKSAE